MDPLQSVIQELERGKESAHHIRSLLHQLQGSDGGDHYYKVFDDHSLVVLTAFDAALSVLRSSDFAQDQFRRGPTKVDRTDLNDSPHHCKSEEESCENAAATTTKDRRGCYKRRRIGQAQTVDTPTLTDDGFAWRKYGQKIILNAKHPRNYYRCTHKHDQGCQATKQVQQISENPTNYRILYHGQHTCNNLLKNHTIFLDTPDEYNSSFFLSFGPNTAKQALNPFIFSSSSTLSSSSAFPSASMVKQEMPSGPSDPHHGTHNQYSPSSDLTTTGLTSSDQGDVFSSAEVYSSTASPHGMEEDYSCMMADPIDLDAVLAAGFAV